MDNQGMKFDQGKPRLDLISPSAELELAKVLAAGAALYGEWNWEKGIPYSRLIAAMQRHINAFRAGEDLSADMKLHHMAHVMANASFLLHFATHKPELDDRKKF